MVGGQILFCQQDTNGLLLQILPFSAVCIVPRLTDIAHIQGCIALFGLNGNAISRLANEYHEAYPTEALALTGLSEVGALQAQSGVQFL